jgi:hypothetical protein
LWVRRDHLGNPANFWIVHLESSAVSRCEKTFVSSREECEIERLENSTAGAETERRAWSPHVSPPGSLGCGKSGPNAVAVRSAASIAVAPTAVVRSRMVGA